MYPISNEYKNKLEQTTSIKSKSKIIVNNVEYTSIIKSTPKFSHKNSSMIGGFPIKTCSFEIYDINNSFDFEDKEITVYKGIEINGIYEYVPQGIFIPKAKQISTNISQKTISFNSIQDKSQLFDVKYKSNLDWASTHTGLEIVQEICNNLNVVLETTTFNLYNFNLKRPNFYENITCREVISKLAEIGGSIAFISRTGGLVIKSQNMTNQHVANNRYAKLSKEKEFGKINVLVFGNSGMNNDIYYPNELPENKIEWKILDNPFVDLYKQEMISTVANYILNQSIIPFKASNFVDGFYLDMNDVVKINDKNGNEFDAVILDYETINRIQANIGADVQSNTLANYNLAGSSKQSIEKVQLDVDHNKKQITALASKTDDLNTQTAQLRLDVDTIEGQISDIADITTTAEGTGTLVMGNINESEPIYIKIYPKLGDITSLYPANDLYPADDLYPLDKTLVFHCTSETYDKTYELPKDLLWLNKDTYDEFVLDYDNQTCYILHRVAINESGEKYALANVIQENFEYPNIPLVSGDYEVSLLGQPNAYLYIRLMVQNLYTNQFATKVEMNSKITQTAKEINIEVGEKVGKEEVIARINLTKETATIQANKVNINGVINAVNNNTTTTINGNKITTGSITASQIQTGTITADKVASDVITTNNFSAQTINADNIKAGTLSASSISLKGTQLSPTYSKVGGWTVNDSELSSGNSTIKSNGVVGFYPQVQNGGILALNDGFRCKAPNGVAIYNTHTGYGNSTSVDNGIHLCADVGNLDLMTEHSSYGVNIRSYCSPSSISNAGSRSIRLAAGQNIAMYAVGGYCYAEGNGVASAKIKTDKGSASSKNVKKNLKKFNDKKYDSAINILKNMDLYEYDYKYDLYKNRHQYGFLIDELEKLDRNEFFNFEEEEAIVKGEHLDFNMENKTKKDKTIKVKKYDSDVLDKYLLTVVKALLNKIEILENKVEKMERKEEKNEKNYPKNIDMHS